MATAATEHQLGRDLKKTKRDKKRANAINQPAGSTSRDSSSSPSSPEQNNDDLINFGGHSWGNEDGGSESSDSGANPDYHTGRYDDKAMGGNSFLGGASSNNSGDEQPAEENQSGDGESQNNSSSDTGSQSNDNSDSANNGQSASNQNSSNNETLSSPEAQQSAAGALDKTRNTARGNQAISENQNKEQDQKSDNPLSVADDIIDDIAAAARAKTVVEIPGSIPTIFFPLWGILKYNYYGMSDFLTWVRLKFGVELFYWWGWAATSGKDEKSREAREVGITVSKIPSCLYLVGIDIITIMILLSIPAVLLFLYSCEGQAMIFGSATGFDTVGEGLGKVSSWTGTCQYLFK